MRIGTYLLCITGTVLHYFSPWACAAPPPPLKCRGQEHSRPKSRRAWWWRAQIWLQTAASQGRYIKNKLTSCDLGPNFFQQQPTEAQGLYSFTARSPPLRMHCGEAPRAKIRTRDGRSRGKDADQWPLNHPPDLLFFTGSDLTIFKINWAKLKLFIWQITNW